MRWSGMASDTTLDDVLEITTVLDEARFIVVDTDTAEVLIRSFVKHDQVADQPKIRAAAVRQFDDIQSRIIRTALSAEYPAMFKLREGETPAQKANGRLPVRVQGRQALAPAYARGRQPVPVTVTATSSTAETTAAAETLPEDHPHITRLRSAGWITSQLATITNQADADRAVAWLNELEADTTCSNPAGLTWTKYSSGAEPTTATSQAECQAKTAARTQAHAQAHALATSWHTPDSDAFATRLDELQTEHGISLGALEREALWDTALAASANGNGHEPPAPPQPTRPRDPEPQPAPPPADFLVLAGRTTEPPAPPDKEESR